MNLVVDAGNTFVKVGIFDSYELIRLFKWDYQTDFQSQLKEINQNYSIKNAVISTVVQATVLDIFQLFYPNILIVNAQSIFPFNIQYNTSQTLGVDRLIGLTSAYYHADGKPFLVLDLGTWSLSGPMDFTSITSTSFVGLRLLRNTTGRFAAIRS